EVENYYKTHETKYMEVTLRRIFIPKAAPAPAKQLSDAERTALAAALQKRAAAGEDFDKLEQEVYTTYGMNLPPMATSLGAQRSGIMPPPQEQIVFNLKPGEVSPVISDGLAEYIYKLESKRTLPLEAVRTEIVNGLGREKYQQKLGELFT